MIKKGDPVKVKFFNEANTYRDLCEELTGVLLATKLFMQAGVKPSLKDIKNAITKAEKLLGEKSETNQN